MAARAGDLVPGSHDALAVQWLRNMARDVPLRETPLAKIAPEWAIEKKADLTWEQAVAEADSRFGERQLERTAFLRHYLNQAVTDAQLDQLKLPEWNITRTGPGRPLAIGSANDPTATITVFVSRGVHYGPPTLTLMNVTVNGVKYGQLTFDEDDRLTGVVCDTKEESGAEFRVGANSWDNNFSWFATVTMPKGLPDMDNETLRFSPAVVLQERSVRVLAKGLYYQEYFVDGKVRRRVHYQERKVEGSYPQVEVVKEETFP